MLTSVIIILRWRQISNFLIGTLDIEIIDDKYLSVCLCSFLYWSYLIFLTAVLWCLLVYVQLIGEQLARSKYSTMEVLMHEMSNGQETNAVDTKVYTMPKQTEKKVENAHVEDGRCFMESNAVDTVDIMFENIKYTVSLGCKKG